VKGLTKEHVIKYVTRSGYTICIGNIPSKPSLTSPSKLDLEVLKALKEDIIF
jgi:hypothetical protein